MLILTFVFTATAIGSTSQDVPAEAEADEPKAPAELAAAPAGVQPTPGQIIIKPTGRKRVSRVGVAPPPPEVDYRVLARGEQPKGGGPYVYYPVGYCPTYSYYGSYYDGYYGNCHRYSSYDHARPYCP